MDKIIRLAIEQIRLQSDYSSSLATRAVGILAFDSVFATALAALGQNALLKFVAAIFLLVSIVLAVIALSQSGLDIGPSAHDLYERLTGEPEDKIDRQVVAVLSQAAQKNKQALAQKDILILGVAIAIIVSAMAFAAAFAVMMGG